jgi:ubiquinone/menaquinone biosynthesis C-methylase UbiE
METQVLDVTYEPFSREQEYVEANRCFVRSVRLCGRRAVLDLACGTGAMTALILEEMRLEPAFADQPARVVGLDISHRALQLAQEFLANQGVWSEDAIQLARARADSLPLAEASMDAVLVGNAIQLFDDKGKAMREIRRVLRPGGVFAFNTSFYAGTFAPGTERFYLRWVQEALKRIQEKDADLRRAGLPGVSRRKGCAKPAFSLPWLSGAQYTQLLEENGFLVTGVRERTVELTQRSFESIGSYAELAGVLLSGYPVEFACEALSTSAGSALEGCGLDVVPRYWIEVIATVL